MRSVRMIFTSIAERTRATIRGWHLEPLAAYHRDLRIPSTWGSNFGPPPKEILDRYVVNALAELGPRLEKPAREFLEAELIDQDGKRRVRTRAEVDTALERLELDTAPKSLTEDERERILDHLRAKAILRWQAHAGGELVELGHDRLASKLLEWKAQRKAEEDQRRLLDEQKAAEEEARKELERQALEARLKQQEAEKERAEARLKQQEAEKERAEARLKQQQVEAERAAERVRASRWIFSLLTSIALIIAASVIIYNIKTTNDEHEKRQRENRAQIEGRAAEAENLAKLSSLLLSDGRLDFAARMLQSANRSMDDARSRAGSLPDTPAPASALLALANERVLQLMSGATEVRPPGAKPRSIRFSDDGYIAAAVEEDGRTVISFAFDENARATPLPSARLNPEPSGDLGPPTRDYEPMSVFSGSIRELDLTPDGKFAVAYGEGGQRVVWSVATGERVASFRTVAERARISISDDRHRLLLWDGASGAVSVSIDPENPEAPETPKGPKAQRESTSVPLREDEAPVRAQAETQSPRLPRSQWLNLAMSADGERVVGVWGKRIFSDEALAQEIQVWSAKDGKKTKHEPLNKEVIASAISADGEWIAAAIPEVRVWSVSRGLKQIEPLVYRSAARVRELWFKTAKDGPLLLIATEDALIGWRLPRKSDGESQETPQAPPRTPAFETPLDGPPIRAAVKPDLTQIVVHMPYEARLYAVGASAPSVAVSLPEMDERVRRDFSSRVSSTLIQRRVTQSPPAVLPLFTAESAGSRSAVLTLADDVVRVRWLDTLARDKRRGRYLGAPALAAEPERSTSISSSAPVSVVADGQRLGVTAGRAAWIVEYLSPAKPGAPPDLRVYPWKNPDAEWLMGFAISGRSTLALDEAGNVFFGDEKAKLTSERVTGFPKETYSADVLFARSKDGAWAAAAGWGPRVPVWGVKKRSLEWEGDMRLKHSALLKGSTTFPRITALAIDTIREEEPRTLVGDQEGSVRTFTSGTNRSVKWLSEELERKLPRAAVTVIETASDGRVAAGAADGTVAIWDGNAAAAAETPPRHDGPVNAVRFVKNGAVLASGGHDRVVRTWDGKPETEDCSMRGHAGEIVAIAAEDDGASARVISMDDEGTAILWSADDCRPVRVFRRVEYAGFVQKEPTRIMTISQGGRVDVWDLKREVAPAIASAWGAFVGPGVLITGDEQGSMFAWRTTDAESAAYALEGGLRAPLLVSAASGTLLSAASRALHPMFRLVAVTEGGDLRAWEDGRLLPSAKKVALEPGFHVRSAALSPEGRLLLVEAGPEGKLRSATFLWGAWTAPEKSKDLTEPSTPSAVSGCVSAPGNGDGKEETDEPLLLAAAVYEKLFTLVVKRSGCVLRFDEDGKLESAQGPADAVVAALNQRGDRLMLGGRDGAVSTVAVESAAGFKLVTPWSVDRRRHEGRVRAIAFHPSGRFAVTAGEDGRAWLWDVNAGKPIVLLGAHAAPIHWAAFDPHTGDEVVTGGPNGWIRSWVTSTTSDHSKALSDALTRWRPSEEGAGP
jgi:WD40 repeat protein